MIEKHLLVTLLTYTSKVTVGIVYAKLGKNEKTYALSLFFS